MATDFEDLAEDVRATLTGVGLTLYEPADSDPFGGVTVLPAAGPGVLVLWELHDRLAVPAVAAEDDERLDDPALILARHVRAAMLAALSEILLASGYHVTHDPGSATGVRKPALIVTGRQPHPDQESNAPRGAAELLDAAALRGDGLLIAPGPYVHTLVQVRPGAAPGGKARQAAGRRRRRCRTWPRAPGRSPSCWPTPPTLPHLAESARALAKLLADAADVAEELDDQAPEPDGTDASPAPEPWRL